MDEITCRNRDAYNTHARSWAYATSSNEKYRFLEKPALYGLLPDDLRGKHILCIGVGSGEELDTIVARDPHSVVAIDLSEKLLKIARERHPNVEYHVMDMCAPDLPPARFDLVYSSLAFHYANDWDRLLTGIRQVMKPGGTLLFSTHHPNYWAKHPTGESHTNPRGVKLTEHTATLPGGVCITYYNHPNTDSISEALTHTGFIVEHAYAPSVAQVPEHALIPSDRKKYKNLVKTNAETPLFWVVWGRCL